MNKYMVLIISILLIVSLTVSACDISITINPTSVPVSATTPRPDNTPISTATKVTSPTDEPIHEIYAGFTDDTEIPFLILHPSGEILGVTQDFYSSNTTGVVWTSPSGTPIVIYADGKSLPKSAVVGELIIRYTNYTNTTVDITVIHPDGKRDLFRAKYSAELSDRIPAFFGPSSIPISFSLSNPNKPQQQDYLDILDTALFDLDVATCVIGSLGAATLGIPGLVIMAKACAGPLVELKIRERKAENIDVGALENIKGFSDKIGCASIALGNIAGIKDCLGVLVTEMKKQRNEADDQIASMPPAPAAGAPTKKEKKKENYP